MRILFVLLPFLIASIMCEAQNFTSHTLLYDGELREYKMFVPVETGDEPLPLLFNFHGGAGFIDDQIGISDMRALAEEEKFVVVYPQALPDPNDDGSTNWIHKDPSGIDDVFFIDALIDEISSTENIDLNRVYACGYSLGGEFTYELACRLNHRIAAIAAVARTMNVWTFNNCAPVHPTGVMTILGTDDTISPYEGIFWMGEQFYLSAYETHDYWAEHNNTEIFFDVDEDGTDINYHQWNFGDACVFVLHIRVDGGGHDWPGAFGNMDINSDDEIWNYVSLFDLTGKIECEIASGINTSESLALSVFPNPTSSSINISGIESASAPYELYSIEGKLLRSGFITSDPAEIDLTDLQAELYFLKVGDAYTKILKR